jgi:hypothetical protein
VTSQPTPLYAATLSATPLADEYRAQEAALRRCSPIAVSFDGTRYRAETVGKARLLWLDRMRSEYESTAVFVDMARLLIAARASIDAVAVVLRMAHDELRHADLCGKAAVAFGGEPLMDPHPPSIAGRAEDCGPEERALRSVIYGCCLSETINAARFVDMLETTTDPFVREVLRQLLSDERMHAQFGYLYLEAWRPWLSEHPEMCRRIGRYLEYAFAVLERDLSGQRPVGTPPEAVPVLSAEERAIGLPDPHRQPVTFYETVAGAILPGLERFGFPAVAAWAARATEVRAR